MIEVSLYAIGAGAGVNAGMGTCIDRTRFDKDALGTGIMEFVKGFLKTNLTHFESALKNAGIVEFINSDTTMTRTDLSCINYWLAKAGYVVKVWNVADDEDNATGIASESAEWNIVDNNFIQNDYPTTVKIIPGDGMDVVEVLKKVIENSDLFNGSKLGATKNPLKETVEQLAKVKDMMGNIEPGLSSKVYSILNQVGINVFLAVGE